MIGSNRFWRNKINAIVKTDPVPRTGRTPASWLPYTLAQIQLPFSVKWEILDVEMVDGHQLWRLMATRLVVTFCCENVPSKGLQTNTSLTNLRYRIQVSLTTMSQFSQILTTNLEQTLVLFLIPLTFKAWLELRATAKYFCFRNEES